MTNIFDLIISLTNILDLTYVKIDLVFILFLISIIQFSALVIGTKMHHNSTDKCIVTRDNSLVHSRTCFFREDCGTMFGDFMNSIRY